MDDFIQKLQNMNKEELSAAVNRAKEFVQTPEGKKLAEKLKNQEGLREMGITDDSQKKLKKLLKGENNIAKTIFDLLNGKE